MEQNIQQSKKFLTHFEKGTCLGATIPPKKSNIGPIFWNTFFALTSCLTFVLRFSLFFFFNIWARQTVEPIIIVLENKKPKSGFP